MTPANVRSRFFFAGAPPTANCSKLTLPLCKGLGYEKTFTNEEYQSGLTHWLSQVIGNYTNGTRCGHTKRLWWCGNFIVPCKDGNPMVPCRNRCEELFESCGGVENLNKSACRALPDRETSTGLCPEMNWPRFYFWPKPKLISATTGKNYDGTPRTPHHAILNHAIPHRTISCHTRPYQNISYHTILHTIPSHHIPHRIVPHQVMLHQAIKTYHIIRHIMSIPYHTI